MLPTCGQDVHVQPPLTTLRSECSYKCTVVERALKQQFLEWGQSCVVMNYLVLLVFMVRSCVSLCPLLLCSLLCILLSIILIVLAIAKDNFPLYFNVGLMVNTNIQSLYFLIEFCVLILVLIVMCCTLSCMCF